jgi:TolB protein
MLRAEASQPPSTDRESETSVSPNNLTLSIVAAVPLLLLSACSRHGSHDAATGDGAPTPDNGALTKAETDSRDHDGTRVMFGAESNGSTWQPSARTVGLFGEMSEGEGMATSPDGDFNLAQVTFASEGGDGDPDVDPQGRFIVFSSTMHREHSDLYRKDITGRTMTQLTNDPADDIMPTVSPDGTKIAFASNRSGNWDLYVMSTDGGQATQVCSDPEAELHPSWSPDGKMLVYCKSGAQSQRWELWVTRLDQPSAKSFVEYGLFPRWSPDPAAGKILFQRARQRGSRFYGVWTIDFANGQGTHPTEIASAGNAAVMHPTWSPDGQRIAFVTVLDPESESPTSGQSDVLIVNIDGSGRTALTSGQHLNIKPVWAADGRVYFTSNRSGVENIWSVSASSALRQPTTEPKPAIAAVSDEATSENSSVDGQPLTTNTP